MSPCPPRVFRRSAPLGLVVGLGLSCAAVAEENRQDPPEADLQRSGDARNLGKDVAGVFVNSPVGQGGSAPDFMFRGFPNGGLTLYDGVARGFLVGGAELAGVERSEFVKGVSSMLYGERTSASGAAVDYITKKPERAFFLRGGSSIGSFGFRRTTLDINAPLDDHVLFRLAVAAQDKKSFVRFVGSDDVYANPVLAFTFGNGDRLTLRGEYNYGGFLSNFGFPTYVASPLMFRLPRDFYAAAPQSERGWQTFHDERLTYEHDFDRNWRATLVADYYGGFNSYGWLGGWRYDGAGAIDLGAPARTHFFTKNFDLQARLDGAMKTGPLEHRLFAGFERWAYYTRHRDRVFTDSLGALDLLAPAWPGQLNFDFAPRADGDDSGWTNSVFAQDQINFAKQWSLLLAARYDRLASYQTLDDPSGVLTGVSGRTASKGFYSNFAPRAGLLFRPVDDWSIYGTYGKSFIPNIGVRLAGAKLAPPQKDRLFEIGMRHAFVAHRLDVDVGVFDMTRDNVQSLDPTNPNGFYSLVTGRQHSHGVEASARWKATENLTFSVAATWLHAIVSRDSNTPTQQGSDLLGAPRRVCNLSARYSFQGELRGLEVGAGFYYASAAQATLPNTRGFVLAPTRNLSIDASYRLNDKLSVTLSVTNLTDSANFTSTGVLYRGEPRTITASASYGF